MAAKKKSAAKAKPTPKAKVKAKPAPAVKAAAKTVTAKPATAKPAATKTLSNDSRFAPLDDRLVIAVEEAETKTAGGLFIPDSASTRPSRGLVLAAGKGRRSKMGTVLPLDVRVGDHVLYGEYSGTKLTVDGREVLILREADVLGVLE